MSRFQVISFSGGWHKILHTSATGAFVAQESKSLHISELESRKNENLNKIHQNPFALSSIDNRKI